MKKIHLIFCLLVIGCYKENEYEIDTGNSEDLFTITSDKTSILADGFSIAQITVSFDNSVDSTKATTVFKTTTGVFLESNGAVYTTIPRYNYDSTKLIAIARLRSSQKIDSANVSIDVGGSIKSIGIKFEQSFPEFSELSSNTLSVKPKNNQEGEVQFSNKILKNIGSPSLNSIVDLNVFDTLYRPIGSFRVYSNRSDTNGNTNYVYVLGDSVANGVKYVGKLYAISRTHANANPVQFIRDTLTIISSN